MRDLYDAALITTGRVEGQRSWAEAWDGGMSKVRGRMSLKLNRTEAAAVLPLARVQRLAGHNEVGSKLPFRAPLARWNLRHGGPLSSWCRLLLSLVTLSRFLHFT